MCEQEVLSTAPRKDLPPTPTIVQNREKWQIGEKYSILVHNILELQRAKMYMVLVSLEIIVRMYF